MEEQEIVIITRKEWGGRDPKKTTTRLMPATKVIFHAATPSSSDPEVNKRVQSIQNYHMVERGWDDIGYNLLIGEDGKIYEGRGLDKFGSHAKGLNCTSIWIAVMGNYNSKEPPEKVKKAMKEVIKFLEANGVLAPDSKVVGHRDCGNTECPGTKLYEFIQKWNEEQASSN